MSINAAALQLCLDRLRAKRVEGTVLDVQQPCALLHLQIIHLYPMPAISLRAAYRLGQPWPDGWASSLAIALREEESD